MNPSSPRPIHEIEAKWQAVWEELGTYRTQDPAANFKRDQKFYGLVEFPFPSGEGIHMGHPRPYIAMDVITRKRRMEGKHVLFPMGWDAFGLPTENFAIKFKVRPQDATKKNTDNFRRQLQSIGLGFDWSREVNTTDPKFFKWTQWQFLKFYQYWYDENEQRPRPIDELPIPSDVQSQGEQAIRSYRDDHRLAYKAMSTINWCPRCKIGLANEEAQGGVCERCGNPVEKREKAQWMIRITKYAERLIQDLDTVDYLDRVKAQQVNWIGKSEGAYIDFAINNTPDKITVFTTRPDTLFGVTYVVLAPEHPLVATWLKDGRVKNTLDVVAYQEQIAKRSEMERTAESKDKTGIVLEGVSAIHPVTGEAVPVWIADYVLATYGTGSVMAVPAHDERDFAFAKKYGLAIKRVVASLAETASEPFVDNGTAINSDFLNDAPTWKAKEDMVSWLEEHGKGARAVTYRLRDWVFSRQRYWGEPIPMVRCATHGYVPVPESQLPVELPGIEAYVPSETGESPLTGIRSWVETTCPVCNGPAERETDTMPNWAGSSWYFLRYVDPQNERVFADQDKMKYWLPVDLYNGGMEHTTLHLLYSRFWYKFLWDIGLIPKECGSEPYKVRRSQGLILAADGEKMSKSKGNGVNPDDVVKEYGADVLRVYQMFIGPFDQAAPWNNDNIEGVKRFLDKVWNLVQQPQVADVTSELDTLFHQTVKKITEGIDGMQFNTCVSQLMILTNAYQDMGGIPSAHVDAYAQLLAPFAPHIASEIWQHAGKTSDLHRGGWPTFDATKLQAATFELVVQINGKVRDRIRVDSAISEEDAKTKALASEQVQKWLEGKEPKQVIYIPGKLVSVVV